jgi:hypothetical protein
MWGRKGSWKGRKGSSLGSASSSYMWTEIGSHEVVYL